MRTPISSSATNRRGAGFTLVELLVVIILILLIASLVVAFAPRLAERQKVPRGADLIQGWLLIAKQRAKRDQVPTGIRLQPDPTDSRLFREMQYIQKPDDFSGGGVTVAASNLAMVQATRDPINNTKPDFSGGFGGDQSLWPVQVGDYIEIKGGGLVKRITQVTPNTLSLASAFPYPIQPTAEYRIIRAPRPLVGEANLDLPKDIVVYGPTSSIPALGTTDILFSPAGPVISPAAGGGAQGMNISNETIVLWVWDASLDLDQTGQPTQGEPLLVTIYMKTGLIAVHPVNVNGSDPYLFTKDGHSSGL